MQYFVQSVQADFRKHGGVAGGRDDKPEPGRLDGVETKQPLVADGSANSYIVCLDAAALGLSEIVFDPSVSDYENVTVTF